MRWPPLKSTSTETASLIFCSSTSRTINNFDVVDILRNVHYVFCPMTADRYALESGISFCNYINNALITSGNSTIRQLSVVWNMVDA